MTIKIPSLILLTLITCAAGAQGYAKSHQPKMKSSVSMASHQAKPKATKNAKTSAQRVTKIGPGEYQVVDQNGIRSTFQVTERGKKGAIVRRRDPKTGKIVKVELKSPAPKGKH